MRGDACEGGGPGAGHPPLVSAPAPGAYPPGADAYSCPAAGSGRGTYAPPGGEAPAGTPPGPPS